jgi:hypothetical protein
MQQNGSIHPEGLSPVDMQDIEVPEILQRAICRMERHITSNKYHKHNHQSMIFKCTHLSKTQQNDLLDLFDQFSSLFDGTLGKVPDTNVHLELKPNSKPFYEHTRFLKASSKLLGEKLKSTMPQGKEKWRC